MTKQVAFRWLIAITFVVFLSTAWQGTVFFTGQTIPPTFDETQWSQSQRQYAEEILNEYRAIRVDVAYTSQGTVYVIDGTLTMIAPEWLGEDGVQLTESDKAAVAWSAEVDSPEWMFWIEDMELGNFNNLTFTLGMFLTLGLLLGVFAAQAFWLENGKASAGMGLLFAGILTILFIGLPLSTYGLATVSIISLSFGVPFMLGHVLSWTVRKSFTKGKVA